MILQDGGRVMTESAAFIFVGMIAGLCAFQIALGAGAPLGRFA